MTDRIRIVVVDDHPLYRSGVVRTLAEALDMQVAGEGGSADEAVELAGKALPDLMLIDISMPGGGLAAVRRIAAAHPLVKLVMLTASEADGDIMEALAAGARGYVLKGVGAHDLLNVVRSVHAGGSYVSPALAGRLLVSMRVPKADAASALLALTDREEDVLRLVSEGKSNKEAGRALGLQEKTVKHYMTNILQKLQVRNRTEAALLAKSRPPKA